MKILVAGNLARHGEYHIKLLREQGIDADLLEYSTKEKLWQFKIISKMKEYDLIHASTELPIFAMLSGKPFVVATTGSDITELAQSNSLRGRMLRLAYRKAKKIIILSPYQSVYADKLKLDYTFLPILCDLSFFYPKEQTNKTFTVFHPTNHLWNIKGNNIFLNGFIEATELDKDIQLVMIKRGDDYHRSFELVNEIKNKIILENTLDRQELREAYWNSDVIADQFISGSTGLIGQEAMACGKPVLQYADMYDKFYIEEPPIINCKTSKDIASNIIKLKNDKMLSNEIGRKSYEWIKKYHGRAVIHQYIEIYKQVLRQGYFNII